MSLNDLQEYILYNFTVANTCFTARLTHHGKTEFAMVKCFNLHLQIIQLQTCYLLIRNAQ